MVFDPNEQFHVFSYENNMERLFHKNYMDILLGYFSVALDWDFGADPDRKWTMMSPEVVIDQNQK